MGMLTYLYVHPSGRGTQVSRLGTESFISIMYQLLLSLIAIGAPLSCSEATELMKSMRSYSPNRENTISVIKHHTVEGCDIDWDAKAD